MKRILVLLLCIVMLTSMIAACGGNSKDPASPGGDSGSPAPSGDPGSAPSGYKEEVVIGLDIGFATVDNLSMGIPSYGYFTNSVFNHLVTLEGDNVKPELAESCEWVDETTWKCKLRDNIYFHNGEKLTAEDVVYTFQRPESCATYKSCIESAEAIDELTLEVKLNQPNMDWELMLCSFEGIIMNKKACEEDAANGPGIGTGPYKIIQFTSNDTMKLERFDDYFGEKPVTKFITFRFYPESSARLIALENGEVDMITNIDSTQAKHVTEDGNLELLVYNSSMTTYLAFNQRDPVLSNVNVRKAICHGIDVDAMCVGIDVTDYTRTGTVYSWNGYGYDDTLEPYEYDPELAKQALADAGYANGLDLSVTVRNAAEKDCILMQSMLKEIGINLKVEAFDTAAVISQIDYPSPSHQMVCHICPWYGYGDWCRTLYYTGVSGNAAIVSNPEIDALIDNALKESDSAKRIEMYKELQKWAYEDYTYLPLYYASKYCGCVKGLNGVVFDGNSCNDMTNVCIPLA